MNVMFMRCRHSLTRMNIAAFPMHFPCIPPAFPLHFPCSMHPIHLLAALLRDSHPSNHIVKLQHPVPSRHFLLPFRDPAPGLSEDQGVELGIEPRPEGRDATDGRFGLGREESGAHGGVLFTDNEVIALEKENRQVLRWCKETGAMEKAGAKGGLRMNDDRVPTNTQKKIHTKGMQHTYIN